MIRKFVTAALVVLAMTPLAACSDNDDDNLSPDAELKQALSTKYPAMKVTGWEKVKSWSVAEGRIDGIDADVWFDVSNQWVMTEYDYGRDIARLPQPVANAIAGGDFRDWTVDDIDYYERRSESFYRVEMETPGQPDVYLLYMPDGALRGTTAVDTDVYPHFVLPQPILPPTGN
jgi:Protein of unknown function (DUF2874).